MSDPTESTEATEPASSRPRLGGPLAVAAITLGMLTWPIAFNLGAYGAVFYETVFQVVVGASILFVIVVVNDAYAPPWRWVIRVALAAPLIWLLASAYLVGSTTEAIGRPAFAVAFALIGVVSVPLTLRLLVDMMMPEVSTGASRRITATIVALVAIVGAIGFLVGRDHPRFLTCEDFKVAGADQPDDCAR